MVIISNQEPSDNPEKAKSTNKRTEITAKQEQGGWWSGTGCFLPAELADVIREEGHWLATPINQEGYGDRLFYYEDGAYRRSGEALARKLADKKLGRWSKPEYIDATIKLLKQRVGTEEEKVDNYDGYEESLLNVKNGMLGLKTRTLYEPGAEYLSTIQLPVVYDPKARSAVVESFIRQVMNPDAINIFWEIAGTILSGHTKHEKVAFLTGPRASGKSTAIKMIEAMVGKENTSAVSLHDLTSNRFRLAELQGKILNVCPDLGNQPLVDVGIFKIVVSGDTVTAERKHCPPFKFRPKAIQWYSANELPESPDKGTSFTERLAILRFPHSFLGQKRDKHLIEKLTTPEALSAILNHALEGLKRLEKQVDFTQAKSIREETEKYRVQNDPVFAFIDDAIGMQEDNTIFRSEIAERFALWCKESGLRMPPLRKLYDGLREMGAKECKKSWGKSQHRAWGGICWKSR